MSQNFIYRGKKEADGFLKGVIFSSKLSRREAFAVFNIGNYRLDRLLNDDSTNPPVAKPQNPNALSADDKKFIRYFIKVSIL